MPRVRARGGRNVLQKLNCDYTSVLCKVLQPLTCCCDARLRWSGQRDWNARAGRRFQRVVV